MMKFVDRCCICKSRNHRLFEQAMDDGAALRYMICENCGTIFQSPRMSSEELNAFYTKGYRTHAQETEEPTNKDLIMQRERARHTLSLLTPTVKNVERHLDIGSSSGAFLQAIQAAYHNVSVGIEPGDIYRSFSKRQGLTIYSSLSEMAKDTAPFDLVSMMHVLEHLPDPLHYLRTLRDEYTIPQGYLLIEVPNLFEHQAFELGHLFAFTPSTLQEAVRQAGFDVLWTTTHGSFRSPILKLFITLLARVPDEPHHQSTIKSKPLGIKLRRRMGILKRKLFTKYLPDWTWQAPQELWEEHN
jgi:hypothetical protein